MKGEGPLVPVPVTVVYCPHCTMPPEYCEYGPCYEERCLPFCRSLAHRLTPPIFGHQRDRLVSEECLFIRLCPRGEGGGGNLLSCFFARTPFTSSFPSAPPSISQHLLCLSLQLFYLFLIFSFLFQLFHNFYNHL
jgi:hypothetical protein